MVCSSTRYNRSGHTIGGRSVAILSLPKIRPPWRDLYANMEIDDIRRTWSIRADQSVVISDFSIFNIVR
jgi:hypothetical protein